MAEAVDLAAMKDSAEMSPEDMQALMEPDTVVPQEPTPEQLGRMELERACAGGLNIITIPASIYLTDGTIFQVTDFRAWGWTPFGAFAIGKFVDDEADTERQIVINGDQIKAVELDLDAYNAAVEAAEAEDGEQS